jgi:glutathione-regulated potassium-efflux system ancillary protein KefG
MQKILILFAHPRFEGSRAHAALLEAVPKIPGITVRDLYELYPQFDVDIAAEQAALREHDVIIWQHPMYWYSGPPLLKQWIDLVLARGWAYGPGGTALAGKAIFSVVSTGGSAGAYQPDGSHGHTLRAFLLPFEQTARLCNMRRLPPFVVHSARQASAAELTDTAALYGRLLLRLHENLPEAAELSRFDYLNDWILQQQTTV